MCFHSIYWVFINDDIIVANDWGTYSFYVQGVIYHKIGRFYPNDASKPCYIYDIERWTWITK